ncbi:ABC transporter ATP-binding protein [Maritimibacter sp. DP1N21-5]|uniref:ABC transporter ATP-binding protein n=1 Tax=Maritimibacter sp. DP1N21-5 TaxID=2836867 RepID=UPI001C461898|nr:ABC transporter ATP-binding protein [Maritimibacter sp. DP1N21-5]MBV7410718.1 ABC transporter ATP-binding protein/permease [Maritimibacter sp. DP1N21-5]
MIDLLTWKKAWALLDARERRNAWIVLGVIIIGALASAAMVGSVMPFLAVLADPAQIEKTRALAWAYEVFGFTSVYGFLVGLGLASFAVIVASSLIQIAKTWVVARFSMMRIHTISYRLLASYLAQPYAFFLNRHSGEMGPRVLTESEQVVTRFLRYAAEFVASSMTTLAIVGLLLWVEPVVAVVSFVVLGGSYMLIFRVKRNSLKGLGQMRVDANHQRFRLANESLTGIKDIKLLGREQAYLERYAVPSVRMASAQAKITVLSQVPQFALHAVALGGVILLCLLLIDPAGVASGAALGGLLPILGVFAFAGQRMMPELSKLYTSLAEMQAGSAAVDAVHEDLVQCKNSNKVPQKAPAALGLKKALDLDDISFSYPNAEQAGLSGVSLSIRAGEKIGIVGSTGAGKTTLADIILGLMAPSEGRLVVDQCEITKDNVGAWMQSVGYVPQDIFLTDAPVAENIALGVVPAAIDQDRLREAAQIARIDQFIIEEMPEGYQTHIGERGVRLSGGQRQRIGIARALYHDADLIVFDEATSALDNLTEREVMEAIDALPGDKTVLMIAHRLSTVKRCDRIIVLDKGRVAGCDTWTALSAGNAAFQRIAQLDETTSHR